MALTNEALRQMKADVDLNGPQVACLWPWDVAVSLLTEVLASRSSGDRLAEALRICRNEYEGWTLGGSPEELTRAEEAKRIHGFIAALASSPPPATPTPSTEEKP